MSEELQSLLTRIQEDAVAKSETEAEAIISKANETAKATVAAAEESAKKLIAHAEKDAEAFKIRAEKSLTQAARDVILSIGETLNSTLAAIVKKDVVDEILDLARYISVLLWKVDVLEQINADKTNRWVSAAEICEGQTADQTSKGNTAPVRF